MDERCAGLGARGVELELGGEHLHYDRAARAWRTHAELAETVAMGMGSAGAPGAMQVGAR